MQLLEGNFELKDNKEYEDCEVYNSDYLVYISGRKIDSIITEKDKENLQKAIKILDDIKKESINFTVIEDDCIKMYKRICSIINQAY